jgi:hypothetical protein
LVVKLLIFHPQNLSFSCCFILIIEFLRNRKWKFRRLFQLLFFPADLPTLAADHDGCDEGHDDDAEEGNEQKSGSVGKCDANGWPFGGRLDDR